MYRVRIGRMEKREEKSRGAGCAIAGIVLISLPVLYVLGIGPAALLAKNNPDTEFWIVPIYFPLIALGEYCQPADAVLTWYMELWGG